MKRKFKLSPLLLGAALFAQTFSVRAQFSYTYITNNGAITITGGSGSGIMVVPATINGLPVTGIGPSAFAGSVLNSPLSVTAVIITNGVTGTLGDFSFSRCAALTNVILGDSITNIGCRVFGGCPQLTQITVDPLNPAYMSVGNILFDAGQKTLVLYSAANTGSYSIPGTVTNIAPFAFSRCGNLTAITIPSGVTSIGSNAFDFCSSLTDVTLPDSVVSIGSYAFAECTSLTNFTPGFSLANIGSGAFVLCTNLTNLTIPDSVNSLGRDAFDFCIGLTNVTLGAGLASIGDSAFWSCTGLASATIPDTVTNLGNDSFWSCTALTNLTIGSGLTRMGTNALYWCPNLLGIFVSASNPSFASIDGVLYDRGFTTVIQFPGGRSGTYTISGNVTSIGNSAFADSSLSTLIVPGSVDSIGAQAFEDCANLTGIHFDGNAPSVDATAFQLDTSATVFFLPEATGWTTTFAGAPALLWQLQIQTAPGTFGLHTNQFGFMIIGTTNLAVVVEGTTGLINSNWQPVQTNVLTGGASYFSDPQWTNYTGRFYRLRSP